MFFRCTKLSIRTTLSVNSSKFPLLKSRRQTIFLQFDQNSFSFVVFYWCLWGSKSKRKRKNSPIWKQREIPHTVNPCKEIIYSVRQCFSFWNLPEEGAAEMHHGWIMFYFSFSLFQFIILTWHASIIFSFLYFNKSTETQASN